MRNSGMANGAQGGASCVRKALLLSLALVLALSPASPARASGSEDDAVKLHHLNLMLMVTGQRCRSGDVDFRRDYRWFYRRHAGILNGADLDLRSELSRRYGEAGAGKALEQMNASIASQYERGHPWLDCRQLRMVASNLAQVDGRATLVEAADQLVSPRRMELLARP
jgi:hypothetical protein